MEFLCAERTVPDERRLLEARREGDRFAEAWLSEAGAPVSEERDGQIRYRRSAEGAFGELERIMEPVSPGRLQQATIELYTKLLEFVERKKLFLVRIWNFVPGITATSPGDGGSQPRYHEFNAGRFLAFASKHDGPSHTWPVPAASAVGCRDNVLRVEFFASLRPPILLENKQQVPPGEYSKRYGALPPLFARGAIYSHNGRRLLISAGTASIVGERSMHPGNLYAQVRQSVDNLRVLVSQFNLKRHDVHFGFGLEDLVLLRVYHKNHGDRERIERQLRSTLDPDCELTFQRAEICREELLVELEGIFRKKGEYQNPLRKKYYYVGDRIRVESLELHVTEHCNLKCRGCDAMSPYNETTFLSVDEARRSVDFLARHVKADIFKLMGGEPTLHPRLVELLKIVKASGISEVLRLTTNGLLLHRMPDAFWESLDRLTVSNYSSCPMREKHVALVEKKAKEFDVVLNLKWIDQFNHVLLAEPLEDRERIEHNYKDCWIRHRSLVVRNGTFFKCTRAAYMDDFRAKLGIPVREGDEASYTIADGIPLDCRGFPAHLLDYLNSPDPLASCRYCLGAAGDLMPHRQLTRAEIAEGVV